MSPDQEHNMPDDLPDLPEIPSETFITDPSQFEALTSPVRMRILKLCDEPLSVRVIAQRLDMPVTSLYYHMNLLEDAGFLQIVHTRKSGARMEKIYRIAGRTITPGPELLANIEDTTAAAKAMTAIVVEPARAESEHALQKRFEGDEQRMDLRRTMAVLNPAQVDELGSRIRGLVDELMAGRQESDDPEARAYAFTYTLLPSELE
jgi:DNA-binding transcriptional ArsR family regulator